LAEFAQLTCAHCRWQSICGPVQMLDWLRSVRMVRRDAQPEAELLGELFRAAGRRLVCPHCRTVGLTVAEAELENDEDWQMARACERCRRPIPFERLEVFPDTRLCVDCQAKADRGEPEGSDEYCPRCGSVMTLRQSRRGVTRYEMVCPQCRR
jgi:hypothetical protein